MYKVFQILKHELEYIKPRISSDKFKKKKSLKKFHKLKVTHEFVKLKSFSNFYF